MEVGGDDERPVDARRPLTALAGDRDQAREPLDRVAVGVVVALARGEDALGELEQARELLAVRVEGRLAEGAVVEAADADAG